MFDTKKENTEEKKVKDISPAPADPKEEVLKEALEKTAQINSIKKYRVITAVLNVRESPSDKAKIIKVIRSGDIVDVNNAESKGAWSKITSPLSGYVMTEFIAPAK